MRAFEIHPPKNPPPKSPAPKPAAAGPRRRRRWLLILLFLLLLGGIGRAFRPDPHLSRARALQAEVFANRPAGTPTAEQKARMQEFRQEVARLSPAQKRELFEPMRQKAQEKLAAYARLSPLEKIEYLDKAIDRAEKARKEGQQRGSGAGRAGGGPPGGAGGPGGGRPPLTQDQIDQRRKERLDSTTPEERALRDQFRRDMNARRQQRGLPTGGGGGRG